MRLKLSSLRQFEWSRNDRSLIVEAGDFEGRQGLYRVDALTGDATSLMRFNNNELPSQTQESRDGSTIYFTRRMTPAQSPEPTPPQIDFALFARDITSGTEKQLLRATNAGRYGTNYAFSPDGKTLYYTRTATAGGAAVVVAHTLEDVVEFYDKGGRANPNLDADIRPLRLTAEEKRALAALLRALTGSLTASR